MLLVVVVKVVVVLLQCNVTVGVRVVDAQLVLRVLVVALRLEHLELSVKQKLTININNANQ